eukprot:g14193.t1
MKNVIDNKSTPKLQEKPGAAAGALGPGASSKNNPAEVIVLSDDEEDPDFGEALPEAEVLDDLQAPADPSLPKSSTKKGGAKGSLKGNKSKEPAGAGSKKKKAQEAAPVMKKAAPGMKKAAPARKKE